MDLIEPGAHSGVWFNVKTVYGG